MPNMTDGGDLGHAAPRKQVPGGSLPASHKTTGEALSESDGSAPPGHPHITHTGPKVVGGQLSGDQGGVPHTGAAEGGAQPHPGPEAP